MDFPSLLKGSSKIVADNSPAILSAIAVTGTLTTAYLSGRAAFKASQIIDDAQGDRDQDFGEDPLLMTTREKVELTWKLYIPAASTVVMTIACIVAANRIGTRRAAALAAAYKFSERAIAEYKGKVVEKLGETKEQAVRDEVAQERIDKNPPVKGSIVATGRGSVLCYDELFDRYFLSDLQAIRKAQNDTTILTINDGYASLSDFYKYVGLNPTVYSDEVGWNNDQIMDLKISTCLAPDDTPCISMGFAVFPIREYLNLH
jgi:hypothetical protein